MGFNDVTIEYDDSGYGDAETEPSAPPERDEPPPTLWSKAGPPVIAGGLLVIAVAVGTYLGMRTAPDSTDRADWPGAGPDPSTASEQEPPDSGSSTDEGSAISDSDDALVDVADEDEIGEEPTGDDPAGGNGTEAAADAANQPGSAGSTGSRENGETDSARDPGSSTSDSPDDSTPATTTPDEPDCEWGPPGRPDHPKQPDHCK